MTRRDKCYRVGTKAAQLNPSQAALAWHHLAGAIEDMGEYDVPKFRDLLHAIHRASLWAARASQPPNLNLPKKL